LADPTPLPEPTSLPDSSRLPEPTRSARVQVKLTDVAAAAGVAPMTVSRVLNTPERVAPPTALRVQQAIDRLGYVPNLVAGGLSSRRSRLVAAVVPTMAHPMFAGMVQSFTDAVRQAGYQVMLSLSGYGETNEDDLVRALLSRRPDGLLLTGAAHSPALRHALTDSRIPVVEIWDVARQPLDMLVGFDHARVGEAVAEFFLAKGHDRFAMFTASDQRARMRGTGFCDTVRRSDGQLLAELILPAPSTIAAGRQALRELLPRLGRRTALFCSSDLVGFGAMVEARQHGIAVPDRLAVCGFGNFELSHSSEPPFTTVNVEGASIGQHAATFLLDRLAGNGTQRRVQVPFRIVERAST
jgi:LacI family transcriptional regulator, gluconate utilization system Gnt-I transcriptional repressor